MNFLADVVKIMVIEIFWRYSVYRQFRLILTEVTVIRFRLSHARREISGLAELLSNT